MSKNNILDDLIDLRNEIESKMIRITHQRGEKAPLLREMIDHNFGWDNNVNDQQSGKRIRPLIVMLVGSALEGNRDALITVGAAIELVHNFTLVHDDIQDQSLERRHRKTVWSIWGGAQAINAGDGIFIFGQLALTELPQFSVPATKVIDISKNLLNTTLDIAEGQIMDIEFETQASVSTTEYIEMITGKTASLIACSAKCGAIIGSNDVKIVNAYEKFGYYLGLSFQMLDDYLGIWGDENITGKSTASDIVRRKKTLPILWGMENASKQEKKILDDVFIKDNITENDVLRVRDLLTQIGAHIHTKKMVNDYHARAQEALLSTGINNEYQSQLLSLSDFLLDRQF